MMHSRIQIKFLFKQGIYIYYEKSSILATYFLFSKILTFIKLLSLNLKKKKKKKHFLELQINK